MNDTELDQIDQSLLYALQEDARGNTNAAISDRTGVSASTVGKRISRLEEAGVVTGYTAEIDYEESGYPFDWLFVCTAPVTRRDGLATEALEIDGVVHVRELMTGRENVHVRGVGATKEDITRLALSLEELGLAVSDQILLRNEDTGPLGVFAHDDRGSDERNDVLV